MRTVLIVLGVLAFLFILAIGGCVGCAALMVGSLDRPDHHNAREIESRYGADLEAIRQRLAEAAPDSWSEAPTANVVAVFTVRETDFTDEHDLVFSRGGQSVSKSGHMLMNQAGTVTLQVAGERGQYPAVELEAGDRSYLVVLDDWTPVPSTDPAAPSSAPAAPGGTDQPTTEPEAVPTVQP